MIAEDDSDSARRCSDIEQLCGAETPTPSARDRRIESLQPPEARSAPTTRTASARARVGAPTSVQLAWLALRADETAMVSFFHELGLEGSSAGQICRDLFEPAARQLGDWWSDDQCDGFAVSLALSRLQNLTRLADADHYRGRCASRMSQRVLIAPPPHETHILGVSLLGNVFREARWRVRSEFPQSDTELADLVGAYWFDAVALALSDALARRDRLSALARTIDVVREASRNPATAVVVGGRAFWSDTSLHVEGVGADVHCASAAFAVKNLDEWLAGTRASSGDASAEAHSGISPCDLVGMITPALARRIERRPRVGG